MVNVLPTNPLTYRWIILAASFLLITITNGLTLGAGLSVFDEHIIKSLNQITGESVPLEDLKFKSAITLWSTAIFGFFAGVLADKIGVKKLMITGLLLLSFSLWLYSHAMSLIHMYWIHIILGLVLCIAGMIVNVILISRWFNKSRGLALGILLAGTSTGNGLFPLINTYLLGPEPSMEQWRIVMVWLSLIPLCLIPLLLTFIKDGPEKLQVTSKKITDQEINESHTGKSFTLIQALKAKNFWLLSLMAFCTFYSILALLDNTFLMLTRELDFSPLVAAVGLTILSFGGFIGKIISGQMAEIFGRQKILLAGVGVMFMASISIVLALFYKNPYFIWIGLTLFGFGWGGLYTLIQLLSADLFGTKSLGKIMGAINILDTLGGGLGPVLTGYLYSQTQGYLAPVVLISVLLVIAFISSSMLKINDKEIQENR